MKIRAWVMTDRVGSKMSREFTIDDEDFECMSEGERLAYIDAEAHAEVTACLEFGWEEIP